LIGTEEVSHKHIWKTEVHTYKAYGETEDEQVECTCKMLRCQICGVWEDEVDWPREDEIIIR